MCKSNGKPLLHFLPRKVKRPTVIFCNNTDAKDKIETLSVSGEMVSIPLEMKGVGVGVFVKTEVRLTRPGAITRKGVGIFLAVEISKCTDQFLIGSCFEVDCEAFWYINY